MSEICDCLCQSISRYVGTMLNGAVSRVVFVVLLSFFPWITSARSDMVSSHFDWASPSL